MSSKVVVVGAKAILFESEVGNELFKQYFGKPFAVPKPKPEQKYPAPFVLSLYEALYLCKKGIVTPIIEGVEKSCTDLEEYASRMIPDFKIKYAVYEDLRNRGYVVRSGMKFGADFTVYEIGPGYEHAPYVVLVLKQRDLVDPISIVRIGRVSHSVRKKLVLAIVDETDKSVNYLIFRWVKI